MPTRTTSTSPEKAPAGVPVAAPVRPERTARTEWVRLDDLRVSDVAQRDERPHHTNKLIINFDPAKVGILHVSRRDGALYVVDGWHRTQALIAKGFTEAQALIYTGLTEAHEAELFLDLNDTLSVNAQDKFKVAVTAGRPVENAVVDILAEHGLTAGGARNDRSVTATGTLVKIYKQMGPDILSRALGVVLESFGDPGLEAALIDGVALVLNRYGARVEDDKTIDALRESFRGGAGEVRTKARQLADQTGRTRRQCVAAVIVNGINLQRKGGGRGGILPKWFAETAPAELKAVRKAS